MPGSSIRTLRYFSGFWARRATHDRVLKILAGGYFDIKRGHRALRVSLSGSLDIWAMWEYRRVRLCGNRYTRRERASRTGWCAAQVIHRCASSGSRCGPLGLPVWETKFREGDTKIPPEGGLWLVRVVVVIQVGQRVSEHGHLDTCPL